jgi:hypothetical protein
MEDCKYFQGAIPEFVWKCRGSKNKKFWEELVTYFPLIQHEPHGTFNNSSTAACGFNVMETCLSSRCLKMRHCLATIGRDTHTDTAR